MKCVSCDSQNNVAFEKGFLVNLEQTANRLKIPQQMQKRRQAFEREKKEQSRSAPLAQTL